MTIAKQFARVSTALDEHMDQLLEVLAALLEEPQNLLAPSAANRGAKAAIADLRSVDDGVTHMVVKPGKVTELRLCL